MNQYLIYALHCPITKKGVYVGKSSSGIDRPFQHIKDKSHSKKINEWVKNLRSEGREPILVILEHDCDASLVDDKEKFWIQNYLSKGFFLLNQSAITPVMLELSQFDTESTDDDPLFEIRNYVKVKRKMYRLTQKELSEKSGVGLRFIRELEQGTKTNFNTDSIFQVLRILGKTKLVLEKKLTDMEE